MSLLLCNTAICHKYVKANIGKGVSCILKALRQPILMPHIRTRETLSKNSAHVMFNSRV